METEAKVPPILVNHLDPSAISPIASEKAEAILDQVRKTEPTQVIELLLPKPIGSLMVPVQVTSVRSTKRIVYCAVVSTTVLNQMIGYATHVREVSTYA